MSASTEPQTPLGAAGEGDDESALLATQFRALRRLHSSIEHLLHSPLNSIGLNLELLSVEIADLAKHDEREGGDPERYAEITAVQKALRAGYARLVASTETIYEVVLPGAEREEEIDLARLVRRAAGLGETEAVLLRATWATSVAPVPVPVRTRRDLLLPAVLSIVSSALTRAGAESRIAFSLSSNPEIAEIEAVVDPCRPVDGAEPGSGGDSPALARLVRRLGGTLLEGASERVYRIHFSLPRFPGAAAC